MNTQVPRRKRSEGYEQDLEWCGKRLAEGYRVWCVRSKATGLVQSYIACADLSTWLSFDGQPLDLFFVQPITLGPESKKPMWGPECAWPKAEDE